LGASSTLINNITQWFGIDAYALLANSFGAWGGDFILAAAEYNPTSYFKG